MKHLEEAHSLASQKGGQKTQQFPNFQDFGQHFFFANRKFVQGSSGVVVTNPWVGGLKAKLDVVHGKKLLWFMVVFSIRCT